MQTLRNYIKILSVFQNAAWAATSADELFSAPIDTKGLVAASGVITLTTIPLDDDTVTVGNITYTFKDTLSSGPTVANEVLIGANVAASLTNLKKAINNEGTEGTHYSTGTVRNATVTAGTIASANLPVTARALGEAGNDTPLSTTSEETDNGVTAFSGGRDGEQFDGALIRVNVGAITGTPTSVTLLIEESDTADFASDTDLASQALTASTSYNLEVVRTKKYIRGRIVFVDGTTPAVNLAVTAILNNWAKPYTLA